MHEEFEQLLEAQWEGRLDEAGLARLEALAAGDPALARRLAQERRMDGLLRAVGPSHAPRGLAPAVFARLDAEPVDLAEPAEDMAADRPEGRVATETPRKHKAMVESVGPATPRRRPGGFWRRLVGWPTLGWGGALAAASLLIVELHWGLLRQAGTPPGGEASNVARKMAIRDQAPAALKGAQSAGPETGARKAPPQAFSRRARLRDLKLASPAEQAPPPGQADGLAMASEPDVMAKKAKSKATLLPPMAKQNVEAIAQPSAQAEVASAPAEPLQSLAGTPPRERIPASVSDSVQASVQASIPVSASVPVPAAASPSPLSLRAIATAESPRQAESPGPTEVLRQVEMQVVLPAAATRPDEASAQAGQAGQAVRGGSFAPGPMASLGGANALQSETEATRGARFKTKATPARRDVEMALAMAGGVIGDVQPVPGLANGRRESCALTPDQFRAFLSALDALGLKRHEAASAAPMATAAMAAGKPASGGFGVAARPTSRSMESSTGTLATLANAPLRAAASASSGVNGEADGHYSLQETHETPPARPGPRAQDARGHRYSVRLTLIIIQP